MSSKSHELTQDKIKTSQQPVNPFKMWRSSYVWEGQEYSKMYSRRNQKQVKFW